MKNVAILASGSGSNAENIIHYFKNNQTVNIKLIITNNPSAFVIQRAINNKINYEIVSNDDLNNNKILEIVNNFEIDFIVLAGFLKKIPSLLIEKFPNKIINIHPALLPKYGGKGMYGDNVHKAVKEANEKETGITIHYVNDKYDDGEIIFQDYCEITESDSVNDIASKVHNLEYLNYPKVIENILCKL